MIISQKTKLKKNKPKFNKLINFYKFFFYTTSIIFLLVSFIFFNSEMFNYYKAKLSNRLIGHGITNYLKLPEILYLKTRGHFINNKKIILEMDFEEILKIESERNERIFKDKTGIKTIPGSFNFYKATLIKDGKKIPIKIRLKGHRHIHWIDKSKSSYRIKIKGDERFNGLKVFSLQKPRIRNYIHEWIYHQVNSAQNDSINLKYEFFDLIINGENYGLYVLEETPSKLLLERNQKRDGPIFSVIEEIYHEANTDPMNKTFKVLNESFWLNDKNSALTILAYTKLTDTFLGKRAINETFDLKILAWYVATVELLDSYHGLYLKSPKYYYNPLKGLFEIIPYDGHYTNPQLVGDDDVERNRMLGERNSTHNVDRINRPDLGIFLSKKLYEDEKFLEEYHLALAKISSIKFLDNFFNKKKDKIKYINSLIYADYFLNDFVFYYGPGLYYFDKSEVYKKAAGIREKLQIDPNKVIVKMIGNLLEVENYNLINPNLKIDKIYCGNNEINFQQKMILKNIKKIVNIKQVLISMPCFKININDEFNNKNFQISISNLKTKRVDTIDEKKFLKYFKIEDKKILLKKDFTNIDENITIPKDYTVIILPGQKITLKDDAFIYSLSNFIIGQIDNDKKVFISGNKDNYGGGLFIDSQKTSQIFNTEFSFLSGYGAGVGNTNTNFLEKFLIYGSINFYNGHAIFKNTDFMNITSEDALNLINIKFDLDNVNFHNISNDGIDVDFGNGSISNSSFNQIGHDAIDLSGSNSSIIKNYIGNAGDKGVSIGESSNVIIDKLEIVNSYIGVAVKDGSVVKIQNSLFKNGDYGVAVYHKKNEYENINKIYLKDVEMLNFKENIIKNKKSFINSKMNLKIQNYRNKKILSKLYEKP